MRLYRYTVKEATEAAVHLPSMTSSYGTHRRLASREERRAATQRRGPAHRPTYDELPLKRSRRDSSEGSRHRMAPLFVHSGGRCTRRRRPGSCGPALLAERSTLSHTLNQRLAVSLREIKRSVLVVTSESHFFSSLFLLLLKGRRLLLVPPA
ncbi:hypothetical protein MTO96_031224 [Rhipicephalus appendiculatus]